MAVTLNGLAPLDDILNYAAMVNSHGEGVVNPEVFYAKQLLDTIRVDAEQYVYFKMADATISIEGKADKLVLRRWAPLQAHTVPLQEGIPPKSDKGSVETYEMQAFQYGRYMELTDKVDIKIVDPVVTMYMQEYSLVAIETLDMLARDALLSVAQKWYATGIEFEDLTVDSKPTMQHLRCIGLSLQRQLVKPRSNGKYAVIGSPEFYFDMIDDPIVVKYMQYNQTSNPMFDTGMIPPMFGFEFMSSLVVPKSGVFTEMDGQTPVKKLRVVYDDTGSTAYATLTEEEAMEVVSGYVNDTRTGQPTSYVPKQEIWTINQITYPEGRELLAHHILILGKDALTRTSLSGEDAIKTYVKPLGSAGVLDPIDQRQSIGFKINSVGFGSTRLEAIVDYICVPTQAMTAF